MVEYLYTKEHKIFFYSFPCELYKWLDKLAYGQGMWKLDNPIVWTAELVRHMESSENKIVRVFNYWIDSILDGFITEFTIDTYVSYSEDEHHFFK